jgi:hypothetical protein
MGIGASVWYVLSPAKKIDDKKDEKYRSKADVHKTLPVDGLNSRPVWARYVESVIPQWRF